jgi:hypothetical protein
MSIIHRNSTDNRDVEFGTNISNRASYGSNSSLEDAVKDSVSEGKASNEAPNLGTERKEARAPRKEDPFGDEEDSDVKYRTMTWRYGPLLAPGRVNLD